MKPDIGCADAIAEHEACIATLKAKLTELEGLDMRLKCVALDKQSLQGMYPEGMYLSDGHDEISIPKQLAIELKAKMIMACAEEEARVLTEIQKLTNP
jgi:hypothetical protein